jgi:hypothetical protein
VNALLTQSEAMRLIALEKFFNGETSYNYPSFGDRLNIPLESIDKKERFFFDITQGRISIQKNSFQARGRKTIILVRVDVGGSLHKNPDGTEIGCPHIHIYREGWMDKWAEPLPDSFKTHGDCYSLLNDFMDYCNIVVKPTIEKDLFTCV